MPGRVDGGAAAEWRRWASKLDQIVTDDGATIDFYSCLAEWERDEVTDRDILPLLTHAVQSIKVKHCGKLTDASIIAVAETCPNLTRLCVHQCFHLTDASITAVAEKCANLAELEVAWCDCLTDSSIAAVAEKCANLTTLRVARCPGFTDASITAVAENCANLAELDVAYTNITDASITAIAENCANLAKLDISACHYITDASIAAVVENCANLADLNVGWNELTALPANIGKLSKLRVLCARGLSIKELPRSIVELDPACTLILEFNNWLLMPPLEVATRGIPAIKRYFEELDSTTFRCLFVLHPSIV